MQRCAFLCCTGKDITDNSMTTESIAGILMLILQYTNDPSLHTLFIESLLPLHGGLYKDLFCVAAYGPPSTIIPAIKLLFHYWPQLYKLVGHSTTLPEKYQVTPWRVPTCQRLECINKNARPSAHKVGHN